MYRLFVICDRSGGEIRANVEMNQVLGANEGFSDRTSQENPSQFSLMLAEGTIHDPSHLDAFLLGTFPGVQEPAASHISVLGYQAYDETGNLALDQMSGEIGAVDRDRHLSFIAQWWNSRFTAIQSATQPSMTRQQFFDALLTNFNIPEA